MTDKEILEKVYERLKNRHHSPEHKIFKTVSVIEEEWQRQDDKPLEGWSSEDSMK